MRWIIIFVILIITLVTIPSLAFAQGMMGFSGSSPDSAAIQSQQQEEQEGKKFLDNLNNKTVTCSQLKDADFEKIGEYFMGQAIGTTSQHISMNNMMKSMMEDKGEEQMHVAWGKRGSNCDTSAAFPQKGVGFIPMMGSGFGNIMSGWGGFGIMGWLTIIIFWILIILGLVALFRYIGVTGQHNTDKGKTPLDVLKERYARGEIDKKEFEQMKKDLS